MSYTLLTWDGEAHTLDDATAIRLIEHWTNAESSFPVNLGSAAISSSSIKSINRNRITEADLNGRSIVIARAKQIEADHRSPKEQFDSARKASDIAREQLRKKGLNL